MLTQASANRMFDSILLYFILIVEDWHSFPIAKVVQVRLLLVNVEGALGALAEEISYSDARVSFVGLNVVNLKVGVELA